MILIIGSFTILYLRVNIYMDDKMTIQILVISLLSLLVIIISTIMLKKKRIHIAVFCATIAGILVCDGIFIKFLWVNQFEYNKAINYAIKKVDSFSRYDMEAYYDENSKNIEYNIECTNGKFYSIVAGYKEYLDLHKDSVLNDNYTISLKFEDRAGDYIIIRNFNIDGEIQDGFRSVVLEGDYDDVLYKELMEDVTNNDIYEIIIKDWTSLDENLAIFKIVPSVKNIYIDVRDIEKYNGLKQRINLIMPQSIVVNLYEKYLAEINNISQIVYGNAEKMDCFLYIKEEGKYEKYWVLPTDNYGDSILLLRYFELKENVQYNNDMSVSCGTYYNGSNLDSFLENIFYKRYSPEVQNIIKKVPVVINSEEYIKDPDLNKEKRTETIYRHVFSLAREEWDNKDDGKEEYKNKYISALKGIYYNNVWLRTESHDYDPENRVTILADHGFSSKVFSDTAFVQPAFAVSPETKIKITDQVIRGERVFVFGVD